MHAATVTIVKKYPPDAGKKMWKLTTDTGEKFQAFPPDAALYEEGGRYELNYTSSEFQGRTYHTIKGGPKTSLVNLSLKGQGGTPAPQANGKSYGADPRQIFVCAIVKEWVPNIPVGNTTELVQAIKAATDAYDLTFGGKAAPPPKPAQEDFNDSLEDTF